MRKDWTLKKLEAYNQLMPSYSDNSFLLNILPSIFLMKILWCHPRCWRLWSRCKSQFDTFFNAFRESGKLTFFRRSLPIKSTGIYDYWKCSSFSDDLTTWIINIGDEPIRLLESTSIVKLGAGFSIQQPISFCPRNSDPFINKLITKSWS